MGGAMDHEYIMNLLPAYLFPRHERVVEEYMCAGFSMGGHVTWRMVREDPRVKIAVPICSLPGEALGPLLLKRAEMLPDKTHLPPAVEKFFLERSAPGTYAGKKILALHGDLDALMPWQSADDEWKRVASECSPGESERWIDNDYGHVVSQEMVRRTAAWFWRWGLSSA
jgi:dienelactone hydrolase